MKRWIAFVFGIVSGWWCGVSLYRLRSGSRGSVPWGWVEVDGVYLRDDGCAVVSAEFGRYICAPMDVRVIVDGELRSDIVKALSHYRHGVRDRGWWRSLDDIGEGEVRIFVNASF